MNRKETLEKGTQIKETGAFCPLGLHPSCSCNSMQATGTSRFFECWPAAMTYVPRQPWEVPYDPASGLAAGTIFPMLNLPFRGGDGS